MRKVFPITDRYIYFNTAFFGPVSTIVIQAVKEYLDECVLKGMGSYEVFARALTEKELARKELAKLLNAHQEEIVITTRATEGMNLVVKSLKLAKDDEVIINDQEYPSSLVLMNYLKSNFGVRIVTVKSNKLGIIDPSDIRAVIGKKTRLISMCHVAYDTGTILPAIEIGKIAKEQGVPYLLDGAQAVGAMKVDVREVGCDFYAMAGQKFLGAGEGTGALYVRNDAAEMLTPLIHGSSYTSEFVLGLAKIETTKTTSADGTVLPPFRFEASSLNYPGIVGLAKATQFLNDLGIENIAARIRHLTDTTMKFLEDLPNLKFIGARNSSDRIFASFVMDGISNQCITASLQVKRIITRALKHCVRVSPHYMNTEEEIHTLLADLRGLVARS